MISSKEYVSLHISITFLYNYAIVTTCSDEFSFLEGAAIFANSAKRLELTICILFSNPFASSLECIYSFIHEVGEDVSSIINEQNSYSKIPDSYAFINEQLMSSIEIISRWYNDIYSQIQNGNSTKELSRISNLFGYGIDENKLKESIRKGSDREKAFADAGSIIGKMQILETLLG